MKPIRQKKIKLRPRDDIHLDLKFDIQTPETLSPWLNILPSLKKWDCI